LFAMEGSHQREDRSPLLDGTDRTGGETATVARHLDLIDDRHAGVAGAQKIAVHRMHLARRVDRLAGRRQGLAQYLPTEQLAEAQIFAPAAKQVFLDFL